MDESEDSSESRPLPPPKPTIAALKSGRKRGNITNITIQERCIDASLQFMGNDFYVYGKDTKRRYREAAPMLMHVRKAVGFQISYSQLLRWNRYYKKYGEAPSRKKDRDKRLTIGQLRVTKEGQFTSEHEDKLEEIMESNPQFYLDEFQDAMLEATGKVWAPSTIWRKLHKLNYSLQVAVLRAKQQDDKEVAWFHKRMRDRVKHPRQVLFVDETARGANASRRRRAWSPKGITPIITAPMVRDFDKQYSLIAACNVDGFIVPACKIVERSQGKHDNNPDRGTVDAERFEQYVEQDLCPQLGSYANDEPNSIVVMDNASVHNSIKIRRLIEQAGAVLVYTAPYSPELNPIENFFMIYKAGLKRLSHDRNLHWFRVHWDALHMVTPQSARAFYKKCGVPNMDVLERELSMGATYGNASDLLPHPVSDLVDTLLKLV